MNKARLRELFGEMKADLRDFYDARRDMIEAGRHVMNRVCDIAAEFVAESAGDVVAMGDGVEVRRAPADAGHAWGPAGVCIVHPDCGVKETEPATP